MKSFILLASMAFAAFAHARTYKPAGPLPNDRNKNNPVYQREHVRRGHYYHNGQFNPHCEPVYSRSGRQLKCNEEPNSDTLRGSERVEKPYSAPGRIAKASAVLDFNAFDTERVSAKIYTYSNIKLEFNSYGLPSVFSVWDLPDSVLLKYLKTVSVRAYEKDPVYVWLGDDWLSPSTVVDAGDGYKILSFDLSGLRIGIGHIYFKGKDGHRNKPIEWLQLELN